jgi:hypothetical protein
MRPVNHPIAGTTVRPLPVLAVGFPGRDPVLVVQVAFIILLASVVALLACVVCTRFILLLGFVVAHPVTTVVSTSKVRGHAKLFLDCIIQQLHRVVIPVGSTVISLTCCDTIKRDKLVNRMVDSYRRGMSYIYRTDDGFTPASRSGIRSQPRANQR